MKAMLKEGAGLSNGLLCTLAVIAGVSVANLYYNQPLLDMLWQDAEDDKADAEGIADAEDDGEAGGVAEDNAEEDKADAGVIADAEDDNEAEGVAEDNAEEVRSSDSTPDAVFVPVRDFVPATGFVPGADFFPVTGFVPVSDFGVFGRGFFRTDQPKWPSASPSAKYSPWE